MHHQQTEIIIINRIPTLRKLTVAALVRLGWENILEFSSIDEGRDYLERNGENVILLLELNVNKFAGEVGLVEKFHKKIPVIATLQVPNKQLIRELSRAGLEDIIVKTYDISEYSNNLNKALEAHIEVEEPG